MQVSLQCQQELFRVAVETAGDVRLQPALQGACAAELLAFCSEASPAHGEAQLCLEASRQQPGFSLACRCVGSPAPAMPGPQKSGVPRLEWHWAG